MGASKLTPEEATREIERLEFELEGLNDSKKKPGRQMEIVAEIEQLRKLTVAVRAKF